MLMEVPFRGKKVSIYKLSQIYDIPAKEIRFRYEHGCRENNLIVKHISKESPYRFITYKNQKMTIKELLVLYPHLDVSTVRKRFEHGEDLLTGKVKRRFN